RRLLVGAVGHRPRDRPRAQLACPAERDGRGDPSALRIQLLALAESDGEHPGGAAVAAGMEHRDLLERGLRLARGDQAPEATGEGVVDPRRRLLALEEPDAK